MTPIFLKVFPKIEKAIGCNNTTTQTFRYSGTVFCLFEGHALNWRARNLYPLFQATATMNLPMTNTWAYKTQADQSGLI